jgi:hypothetical protein
MRGFVSYILLESFSAMMQTIDRMIAFLILAAAALGPACSRSQPFQAETTTESGISVITNSGRPLHKNASLKLAEELTLDGRMDGNDPFSTIDSFTVDRDGTIFVCDERAALIRTFSGRGNFLGSTRTAKPEMGELEHPQIVGITSGSDLAVESSGHGRLVFYSRDGRLLRSISLAAFNTFRLGVDSRGQILIQHYRYVRPNVLYYLRLYDSDLKELKSYGQYWEPQSVGNDFYAYLPILWWAIDGRDGVVYGYPQRYELKVFGPQGEPSRIIRKERLSVPITEREKAAYRTEYAQAPYLRIHFPDVHSAYQKFTVDEKGWIYVMTWEQPAGGKGYWYDVFDENGIYTARIALSHMPQIWAGNRLYTLDMNASGSAVLARHRFAWDWR